MVKAHGYLETGKAKKSAMLDDFCESTGYDRRHAAVHGEPKRRTGISVWKTRHGGFSCR
jgi:hypothetical protein